MLIGETVPQLYNYLVFNPAARERSEFSHILVDEFQDLNKSEQGVISLLSENAEICIVGDDDQSIYSFKHAHPEGIREWLLEHPGADNLTLGECHRCPTKVVAMANSLIAKNISRPVARTLAPLAKNGAGVVQIIQYTTLDCEVLGILNIISNLLSQGNQPGDILVLAQRGAIGTPIYEGLVTRNIPVCSYYAEAELDAEDTQRRFSLLKLFVSREDRVALRWLLGLGHPKWHASSYARLRKYCETSGDAPWDALEKLESGSLNIPYARDLVNNFTEIKNEIAALNNLADMTAIVDYLFPENDEGVRDIRALALKTLDIVGVEDRSLFLMELTSAIAKPEIPLEIEDVRIMSLHKSKGLSSPVTIIAGCVEGLLPKQPKNTIPQVEQDAELEEQRRLFYVGISRVKSSLAEGKPGTLILTYSQEMPLKSAMGAGISPASVAYGSALLHASRFIRDMGNAAPAAIAG
jgi:superfamily I DNA/RNA helicase